MKRWIWYAMGFLAAAALIVVALYMEHVMGLEPCPLCVFQRVALIAFGIVCLLAALHNPQGFGARIYALLATITAIGGAGLAGRQLWLQSLPADRVPECGPGLEYLMNAFPWRKVLEMVLTGSGECAEVQWRFLGISIPGWTLMIFIAFSAVSLWFLFSRYGLARRR